jgi:hypothetical protein
MDIWGDNFVIEVAGGGGTSKTTQAITVARASGKRMAVYGPNLKGSVAKGIEANGIPVFREIESLEAWIAAG